jgi:hypothetical protein
VLLFPGTFKLLFLEIIDGFLPRFQHGFVLPFREGPETVRKRHFYWFSILDNLIKQSSINIVMRALNAT